MMNLKTRNTTNTTSKDLRDEMFAGERREFCNNPRGSIVREENDQKEQVTLGRREKYKSMHFFFFSRGS